MSQQHTYPQTTSIVMVIVERATFNTNTPLLALYLMMVERAGGGRERELYLI